MPLQHSQANEEQPAPLRTIAPQEAVQEVLPLAAAAPNMLDTPRYDAAAVKQIIALAEQMQTHHRQTMTPHEVVALSHEVGVEPEFIRRALAQMASGTAVSTTASTTASSPSQTSQAVAQTRVETFPFQLTRKQRRLLAVPVVLYLLLLPFTLGLINLGDSTNNSTALLMYMIVPTVLALYLGGKSKSCRFGALLGVVTGLTALVSIAINNVAAHHYSAPPGELLNLFAVWVGAGLVLGASGAAARTGRRLRIRVGVELTEPHANK